jgi:hypothetical protein
MKFRFLNAFEFLNKVTFKQIIFTLCVRVCVFVRAYVSVVFRIIVGVLKLVTTEYEVTEDLITMVGK